MKLRIVGDGSWNGTRLETQDGQLIEGVHSLKVCMGIPRSQLVEVVLFVDDINLNTIRPPMPKVEGDRED
jgi:hypothetical protein